MLDHLLRLGPAYHVDERIGELVTTAVEGVERLEAYFARSLPQAALSVVAPGLVTDYVAVLDPLSAAVLLATGPAIVVLMVLIGKHAEEHTRLRWAVLSRMCAHLLDVLRGPPRSGRHPMPTTKEAHEPSRSPRGSPPLATLAYGLP